MAETVRENALRLLKAMNELQARNQPNVTVEVRALEAERAGLAYRSETYDDAMEWLLVKGALREDLKPMTDSGSCLTFRRGV